jgi:hypothetical protein
MVCSAEWERWLESDEEVVDTDKEENDSKRMRQMGDDI